MRRMRNILVLAALIGMALLMGCARARVTTEIRPDGTWTRTVLLTGQEKKEGSMTPSIEDTFVFPAGAGWKLADGKNQNDITKSFERTLAAGASLKGDVAVKEDKDSPKPKLVNEVTVTKIGPKRFEYRETLRWTGAPPKDAATRPQDIAGIKALLPKALATDANANALADRAAALAVPMLFGPGDPLLAIAIMHPDLAERRARARMGVIVLKALEEQFPTQMTPADRRDLARKIVDTSVNSTKPSQPDPASGGEQKSGGLTPLLFVLRAPGKLISSNGEFDELSGEVYWGLFPEAASMQPVVLTAVYEVP